MKRKYLLILFLTVLAVLLTAVACGGGQTPDVTDAPGDGTSPTSGADTEPAGEDPTPLTIHSIAALNQNSVRDSHGQVYSYSSLERSYRESANLKSYDLLGTTYANYPRVKKLPDGNYFMLLQNGKYGGNILYCQSKNGVNYTVPRVLFSDVKILGGADTRRYMTADATVLQNGDILVVCSYRAVNGYRTMVGENGIVSKRSRDGGKTWEDEQIIYVGTNWEPYVFQQKSGEIQVYFSSTAEKIYLYGYSDERISSGVGMIRSTDNGVTWTPDVKGAPYAPQMVMKQYTVTRSDGVKCFTDQMASAVELHNGTIAVVGESRFPGTTEDVYKISVGFSDDNWATWLGADETGPATRVNNLFVGAGPYLSQFESGETLLTYNHGTTFYAKLGSDDATSYGTAMTVFDVGGFWGSCLVDGTHSAILTAPSVTKGGDNPAAGINVARFYLNHDVNAQPLTPELRRGNEEWSGETDALFIGSDSQAQVSFRFAYDNENVYVLAERLDYYLTTGDSLSFMFDDGGTKSFYNVKTDLSGLTAFDFFDGSTRKEASPDGVEAAVLTDGTKDDQNDTDNGTVTVIKVPKKYVKINDGKFLFYATVYNKDNANEKASSDSFSLTDNSDKTTWQRVLVK